MKWFPQFPRIRFKRSPTHSLPYNCSPQEAAGLAVLRGHPAWKHLQNLLERVAQSEYDRLASGLPYEEYLAQVGAYQSAKRAVELVDAILDKVKDTDDRTKSREQHATDHRKLVAYGTPFWDMEGRRG